MAPKILIFSIAIGADYSFYVKFIATRVPTFWGHIISVLVSVLVNIKSSGRFLWPFDNVQTLKTSLLELRQLFLNKYLTNYAQLKLCLVIRGTMVPPYLYKNLVARLICSLGSDLKGAL